MPVLHAPLQCNVQENDRSDAIPDMGFCDLSHKGNRVHGQACKLSRSPSCAIEWMQQHMLFSSGKVAKALAIVCRPRQKHPAKFQLKGGSPKNGTTKKTEIGDRHNKTRERGTGIVHKKFLKMLSKEDIILPHP